jgi:hypothetical protein
MRDLRRVAGSNVSADIVLNLLADVTGISLVTNLGQFDVQGAAQVRPPGSANGRGTFRPRRQAPNRQTPIRQKTCHRRQDQFAAAGSSKRPPTAPLVLHKTYFVEVAALGGVVPALQQRGRLACRVDEGVHPSPPGRARSLPGDQQTGVRWLMMLRRLNQTWRTLSGIGDY